MMSRTLTCLCLLVMALLCAVAAYPMVDRRAPNLYSSQYAHYSMRPSRCNEPTRYIRCYLCGKMMEDRDMYLQCCARDNYNEFCRELTQH